MIEARTRRCNQIRSDQIRSDQIRSDQIITREFLQEGVDCKTSCLTSYDFSCSV